MSGADAIPQGAIGPARHTLPALDDDRPRALAWLGRPPPAQATPLDAAAQVDEPESSIVWSVPPEDRITDKPVTW